MLKAARSPDQRAGKRASNFDYASRRRKHRGFTVQSPACNSPLKDEKRRVRMPVGAFSRCVPWGRYPLLLFASDHNPLDLIERDLIAAPVIEAGSPGRLMGAIWRADLQRAAVLEVSRDPGGAERVAADLGLDAGLAGPPAN